MSKKDFIALADKLRPIYAAGLLSPEALGAIMDFCAASNSMFKRERFFGYLTGLNGPSGGTVKNKK